MSIVAWLDALGLSQYEQAFLENDIDVNLLPTLTGDDLRELGVASLGHRKRLLAAIASLAGSADPQPSPAPPIPPPISTTTQAERRQLTVMFCDLVGSTALSAQLDPEDLRDVIATYHKCVAETVARFDGFVAKYMGDGVLMYFGYPQAHEDDAERAVRSGLDLVRALAALASRERPALRVRIGIATGLVVVGDLLGEGAAQEHGIVGETPNLAARLQALARPDSVVISRRTRRIVHGLFDLTDLGAHELKGFSEPVRAWQVLGPSRSEGRFEARHASGLTPLVGREHELGLLLDRWQQAKEGDGQVVLLSGEPGIGKSRLVRALRERLADEPCTPLSHFCSPFHQTSALHPVIELLERAAGLARDEAPERRLDKLEALLARSTTHVAVAAPLLAALLSVPTGERYPPLSLTPQRQKEETFGALLDQLTGLAAARPVLALYEDVHWADPTTLELLERVIERVQRLPVLVLITFRPDFIPPWRSQAHLAPLTLNRLSRTRGAALVTELTGGKTLPSEVLNEILAKTDGVPLFLEELTKTVLEAGLLKDEGERYALAAPVPTLAIPSTLRDSLMARLDRLGGAKEVLQVGAAIGREFGYALLAAVIPLDEAELQDALRRLAQAELIFAQGAPPHASYIFKHALVRDAAYESLLKSRRKQLHARIAHVLEQHAPGTVEAVPEVLAHHFSEAGMVDKAVGYWLKAGQQAATRSAMVEAVAQFRRGLDLLSSVPDAPERRKHELDLQLGLGNVLTATKGLAATETTSAYDRAHELCLEVDSSPKIFPALYGQWVGRQQRGELTAAHALAAQLLCLAQERGDVAAQVTGCRALGSTLFLLGRLAEGRARLEEGLALYDPVRDRTSGFTYAIDSRVVCLYWLSQALLALGFPEQALARTDEVLLHGRELAHPNSMALALLTACTVHERLRQCWDGPAMAEALIALATQQGLPLWSAAGRVMRGWALADGGRLEEGIGEMRGGFADYRATEAELWSPDFLALLAEAHGRAGQAAVGLSVLADAFDRVERSGGRWIESDLHRLRGELLLALPEPDAARAEGCFRHAITNAREQCARMPELRSATSLARLWCDKGRQDEARDVLAPVYGWFTEGFDTPALKRSKALLDSLHT